MGDESGIVSGILTPYSSVLLDPSPEVNTTVSPGWLLMITFWPPVTLVYDGSVKSVAAKVEGPCGTLAMAIVPCRMWYSRMLVTTLWLLASQSWYFLKASSLGATICGMDVSCVYLTRGGQGAAGGISLRSSLTPRRVGGAHSQSHQHSWVVARGCQDMSASDISLARLGVTAVTGKANHAKTHLDQFVVVCYVAVLREDGSQVWRTAPNL